MCYCTWFSLDGGVGFYYRIEQYAYINVIKSEVCNPERYLGFTIHRQTSTCVRHRKMGEEDFT